MSRLAFLRPLAAVAALAVCTTFASALAARAGTFDDYRIPDHHVLTWIASLAGRAGWGSGFRMSRSEWNGTASGGVGTQASGLAESEAALTTWSASASANGYRIHDLLHVDSPDALSWQEQEDWTHSLSQAFTLSGTRRWWPSSGRVHAVAAAAATGNYSQNWNWQRSDQAVRFLAADPVLVLRQEYRMERRTWDHQALASAGMGVGRTRDATGAYEARLLEDRLREAGLLVRPLSAAARRDLAALLAVRGDVSATHDRPAAIVWEAIQRLLDADGALRDEAMSAEAWFRLTEPWFARSSRVDATLVPVSPVLRLRGCMLEARIEGRTGQDVSRWSSASSQSWIGYPGPGDVNTRDERDVTSGDRAVAGLAAEGHWPIGLRFQVDASASALADLRPGQHGIDQRADATANWMAAPRWLVTLTLAQTRTCFMGRGTSHADDTWTLLYGLAAEYAVTDHVDAALRFAQTHGRAGYGLDPASPYWEMDNKGQVVFSLSYRFAGRASAPGLFTAR